MVFFSSAIFGVVLLASCGPQGQMAESSTQPPVVKMDEYLNLPKDLAGSEKVLREEGYRVKNISERKLIATKKFEPAVIFQAKNGVKTETRKHIVTVFKPEGYDGEGTLKISEFRR